MVVLHAEKCWGRFGSPKHIFELIYAKFLYWYYSVGNEVVLTLRMWKEGIVITPNFTIGLGEPWSSTDLFFHSDFDWATSHHNKFLILSILMSTTQPSFLWSTSSSTSIYFEQIVHSFTFYMAYSSWVYYFKVEHNIFVFKQIVKLKIIHLSPHSILFYYTKYFSEDFRNLFR